MSTTEEGFVSSEGLFVVPKVGITAGGLTLPGIFIGIGIGSIICLLQAWRYTIQPDFGIGFPEVDQDKLQHCFLCCRITRCTLRPDLAFRLQLLWEIIGPFIGRARFDFEDALKDTMACVKGIVVEITESCLTGCARSLSTPTKVVLPIAVPAQPCRY